MCQLETPATAWLRVALVKLRVTVLRLVVIKTKK